MKLLVAPVGPPPGAGGDTFCFATHTPWTSVVAGCRAAPSAGLTRALLALGGVILDRLADRLDRPPDERPAVVGGPVPAPVETGDRVLEAGHDESREQLVGPERRLAVGPVVRHEEVGAEAARLGPQPLD